MLNDTPHQHHDSCQLPWQESEKPIQRLKRECHQSQAQPHPCSHKDKYFCHSFQPPVFFTFDPPIYSVSPHKLGGWLALKLDSHFFILWSLNKIFVLFQLQHLFCYRLYKTSLKSISLAWSRSLSLGQNLGIGTIVQPGNISISPKFTLFWDFLFNIFCTWICQNGKVKCSKSVFVFHY